MAENKEHGQPIKKFLFDLNCFDEPDPVDPADIAPTFSEEQLSAARAEGYAEGHATGTAEGKSEATRVAVQSREQLTANTLRTISESFTMLFAAEYDREKTYEQEAVRLTLSALQKLFPVLNQRFGQEEIRQVIMSVLESSARRSMITIEVSTDDAQSIESMLAAHWSDPEAAPRYRVLAQPDLHPGQCRMNWEDGGAVRDAQRLADKITQALDALLEGAQAPMTAHEDVPAPSNNAINEQDTGESAPSATPTGEKP